MTDAQKWNEGQEFWWQYMRVNNHEDTGLRPTRQGIKKLSNELKISQAHLRRCINAYLWDYA